MVVLPQYSLHTGLPWIMDMKFDIHIHIHIDRFYVDIHGYIYISISIGAYPVYNVSTEYPSWFLL